MRASLPLLSRALIPIALFHLNAWLIWPLFTLEYGIHMGSIECTYMAIARFLVSQWPDITWFRNWYGGVPLQSTYPPVLNWITAGWSVVHHASPALAYHQVIAVVYAIAPVTLYFLAVRLGASRWAAGWAALAYSLVSPSAILIEEVRIDSGSRWAPRRFHDLLPYGEGPHETALVFVPLAILLLDRALTKRTPARLVLAALAMAAAVGSNWFGVTALGVCVIALWIARSSRWKEITTTLIASLIAYGLLCFFIPPGTIGVIQRNSQLLNGYSTLKTLLPFAAVSGLALRALRVLAIRFQITRPIQFFTYTGTVFTAIVLGQFWFGAILLPQASRYQLEMDAALVFLVVLALWSLSLKTPRPARVVLALVATAAAIRQVDATRQWCRYAIVPIDLTHTIEYQIASWAQEHVGDSRIYLSGSPSFWLNVWQDVPQLGGDFNNGIIDWNVARADQAALFASAPDTLLWLKAWGVGYFEMVGGKSRGNWHYMQNPGKFQDAHSTVPPLAIVRHEVDDTIFRIDGPAALPAHVLQMSELVARTPRDFTDVLPLRPFVAALEQAANSARLRWTTNHSFEVSATLSPSSVISVAECWYPGWRARIGNQPVQLWADGLGLMAASPHRTGPTVVTFEYAPSRIPLAITLLSWIAGVAVLIRSAFARQRSSL